MFMQSIINIFKNIFCRQRSKGGLSGTIKFFDRKKRFGFITSGQQDYFFHASVTKPNDFKRLNEGAAVKFTIVKGKRGLQAEHVEVI